MAVSGNNSSVVEPEEQTVPLSRSRQIAILKALADPRRLQLIERIACSACPVGCAEAMEVLAVSPATLSHHIKELETAGLVTVERQGKFIHLSLHSEVWSAFLLSLGALGNAGQPNP
jgi:ArsR family transcriptional regulator